jgi:hypothetical protein
MLLSLVRKPDARYLSTGWLFACCLSAENGMQQAEPWLGVSGYK